jgi:Domain of unknown function (DUF4382)
MRHVALRLAALALAATTGLWGCSNSSGPGSGNGPHLTVRLTDAAGDVQAAVVTISEVSLQGPAGKVTLSSTPMTTDLVSLADSTTVLVNAATVAEADYSELRFVITGGYVQVDDGNGGSEIYASSADYAGLPAGAVVTGQLQMPSLGSSGLKVDFADQTALAISGDEDLLVDFDVSQSFGHQAGNSGMWVMHPVVKGATFTAAGTVTATLELASGVTLPTIAGTAVTLADFQADLDGERQPFTDADGDGVYEAQFRFVVPGSYSLNLRGPAGLTIGTTPSLPVSLDVTAGASETTALTLTSALVTP